jgi:osmotically-inducible protein OsmY
MRVHHWAMLFTVMTVSAGCSRQDAEGLSRIGRKISAHAKGSAGDVGGKVEHALFGSKKDPSLQEKVQDRLRWDNALADVKLEVSVKNKEVELKGEVKTAQQRLRAIDLAETSVGVEKVTDAIVVREAE